MRPGDPLAEPAPLIRRVYSYVAYRIGSGPEAEDVTGEVFERAVRYRDTYDASRGQPLAWLLGIARRTIEDARLRRHDVVAIDQPEHASHENVEEATITRLSLAEAMDRLDDRERDLLALRYGADLSTREIGRIVGLKANAVDVALHRVRTRLGQHLQADERESAGGQSVPSLRRKAREPS